MNRKSSITFVVILGLFIVGAALFVVSRDISPRVKISSSLAKQKLQVVASFYPLYFFAQEIGGEKAEVYTITPAGAEPHDYEPTAQDIARIEKSALLIMNGGGLEAWGSLLTQTIDQKQTRIVEAGQGLTTQHATEEGKNMTDPHVWLSPPLAEKMVDAIARGFISADAANASLYEARASNLKVKIATLDQAYQQGLSACVHKDIITAHAAFGYLASAYHFNQIPIAGLSPDAEPSPRQLADIAQFAKKNNVRYIFFENLVSPKLSETIAREVGAQTLVLNPLEGLSLQEEAQGKNYFTEMYTNLSHLKQAMECKI